MCPASPWSTSAPNSLWARAFRRPAGPCPTRRPTPTSGSPTDVFSKGFICPKGASFGELDADPDRLRAPLVRRGGRDGELEEASWQEAFDLIAARLRPLVEEHGPRSVGVVLGNPNVHTMAGALYPTALLGALRTRNLFTASTLDQMPKHVSSGLLFGDPFAIPVPDLDRTDHLLLLGANPLESNGSLCTAPDFPGKLRALRKRGGTLTVVDPRRTRTARLADRHVAIRPGTDALLLAALAQVLFEEKLTDLGRLADHAEGMSEVHDAIRDFTPEAVGPACDMSAGEIRAIARELAAAPTAAVYGRIGSCTVECRHPAPYGHPRSNRRPRLDRYPPLSPHFGIRTTTHRHDLGFCSYCSHVNILLTAGNRP